VEDSPGDVRLIKEALLEARVRNEMFVVGDGVEALDFVHKRGHYADAPQVGLVLLDLNLPRKNGFEVLQEIKDEPNLKRIPVVVLTTSQADQDILKSYDLHANAYISKPVDLEQFLAVVKSIEEFWLEIVHLPQNDKI
jgi:CheY-like chemotaxis protein